MTARTTTTSNRRRKHYRLLGYALICLLSINAFTPNTIKASSKKEFPKQEKARRDRSSEQKLQDLRNKAEYFAKIGDREKEIKTWHEIIEVAQNGIGEDHPFTADAFNYLGYLLLVQGSTEEAEKFLMNALTIQKKVHKGDSITIATTLHLLATLNHKSKRHKIAEKYYLAAIAILNDSQRKRHLAKSQILANTGTLYMETNNYTKAKHFYEQSVSIRTAIFGAQSVETAEALEALASLYAQLGLYKESQTLYLDALLIYESTNEGENIKMINALKGLAYSHEQQGEYKHSEKFYIRALQITESDPNIYFEEIAEVVNNLANLYTYQGIYEKAVTMQERAYSLASKAYKQDTLELASYINDLAFTYHGAGQQSKAEKGFLRALKIHEQYLGRNHYKSSHILNNLASVYAATGNLEKAGAFIKRGLESEILYIQRIVQFLPVEKRLAFTASIGRDYETPWSFSLESPKAAEIALFAHLNRNGILADIQRNQAKLLSSSPSAQAMIAKIKDLVTNHSLTNLKKPEPTSVQAQVNDLEERIYLTIPTLKPRIIEITDVASALPKQSVLVEFKKYNKYHLDRPFNMRWGRSHYLAIIVRPDASISVADLGDASILEEAISSALMSAGEYLADSPLMFAKLSEILIKPLQQATAGANTWYVSPDAELNRLPFAALPMPGGAGYLSEAVNLNLITTGRELLDLRKPRPSAKSSALVVANPAYNRNGGTSSATLLAQAQGTSTDSRQRSSAMPERLQWEPLPATAVEGESVKAITGGTLLLQQQATAEAVKRTPAPKLLHLASHAFYLPNQKEEQPGGASKPQLLASSQGVVQTRNLKGESALLRSGIALAGANQPNADPNDDGYLTALEVAQLNWEGTELVVISACESGLGDLQVGEGVYGLKRAIAVAGARSSLLTLWKVDDDATRLFMESFYTRLKQGEGKAAALAATQKEFRESPELSAYSHPYYWAAFQLSGDGGPIEGL